MAAGDILHALTILNRTTLMEVLDHAGVHLQPGEETATGKLDLLNLMECAVVDLGIECFVAQCDAAVVRRLASWFGVSPSRKSVVAQIRCRGLFAFLQQADICILKLIIMV